MNETALLTYSMCLLDAFCHHTAHLCQVGAGISAAEVAINAAKKPRCCDGRCLTVTDVTHVIDGVSYFCLISNPVVNSELT